MAKKSRTKKAFFTSIVSFLLSFSMLVGTTFAWFTDSVSSTNNIIKAGNLDVTLEYLDGETWTDVEGASEILDPDALWEPGYTEDVYLRIKNAGSLALKYQFGINIVSETAGVNAEGDKFLLSDYIYFDVKTMTSDDFAVFANRAEAMKIATETTLISKGYAKNGKLEANSDYVYLAMVVYMPTSVGNVANHDGKTIPEINLGINVVATQVEAENDSFDNTYDKDLMVTVEEGGNLAAAIAQVVDGGTVCIEAGEYNLTSGPIVLTGKTVNVVGVGNVTLNKNYGGTHVFTVSNGATLNLENLTIDGQGNTREGVYVRWNSNVTLENVTIKNTGGKDIMIDEASDAATHGEETYSVVNLVNSHVEDVAMCASPVTSVPAATQDTFVYFNYDATSTVGSIDKQSINLKPENIYVNGVNSDENGVVMQLYVTNDAELANALNTIKTNSAYWNKQVIVNLAAGEYSGNHVVYQYPEWNGVVGGGATANNMTSVAGKDTTFITFVGEKAATYARTSASLVTFTGNVTVNGFGYSGGGFGAAVGTTTFENICFDAKNSVETNGEDAVVMYVKAAANNVSFNGCTFQNATHVTLGGSGADGVGKVSFDGCYFDNGGCLSGYVETLNVKDTVVEKADNGFINKSKSGKVTVENCEVTAGKYFLRTASGGSGVEMTVADTKITMYEAEGKKDLVNFRGSSESASFTDCTIADGYTTAGVDANSTIAIENYEDIDGVTYVTDGVSGELALFVVPETYEEEVLEIPEGVSTIGGWSFSYNANVKKVEMPSTLTTIARKAFDGSSVEEVVLPEGFTTLENEAFSKAINLKKINFPSTLKTISYQCFRLAGFETLTIPETVTMIGEGSFRDLPNLTTVIIEGNPTIANFAFRSCPNLTSVTLKGMDVKFSGTSQAFCKADNAGDMSTVTFYVENQVVADRLAVAQGSAKGYALVINNTANPNFNYDSEQNSAVDGLFTGTAKNENGKDVPAYALTSTDAYKWMADAGDGDFSGDIIVLGGNIDFEGEVAPAVRFWDPENPTEFDGNGKTLSNFEIPQTSVAGLFSGVADVKNLNVESATVKGSYAGVIAGNIYGDIENVTVKDCTINGTYWQTGALVGQFNSGNIINCTVENCTINGKSAVGALVGIMNETAGVRKVENCIVRNCKINQTGSFGVDYDKYFGIAFGLINIDNSRVEFNNCTFENNMLKGVVSDVLFGEAESSTKVFINGKELVQSRMIGMGFTGVLTSDPVMS